MRITVMTKRLEAGSGMMHAQCCASRARPWARPVNMSPDTQLSWFPRHRADDPFVGCLGFTGRSARLMRLCGFVLSQKEAYEDHF